MKVMRLYNLKAAVAGAGYEIVSETEECPVCSKRVPKHVNRAGNLFRRVAKSALLVRRHNDVIVACRCGYRKRIDNNPKCSCGNALPNGRKQFCYECRPPKVEVDYS